MPTEPEEAAGPTSQQQLQQNDRLAGPPKPIKRYRRAELEEEDRQQRFVLEEDAEHQ